MQNMANIEHINYNNSLPELILLTVTYILCFMEMYDNGKRNSKYEFRAFVFNSNVNSINDCV